MHQEKKLKVRGVIHDTPTGFNFEIDPPLSLRKAARLRCLDCCAGSAHEVRMCPCVGCGLWPHRVGRGIADKNGNVTTKQRSPAQREAARRNVKKMLAKSKKKTTA